MLVTLKNSRHAFTLIELLIYSAIFAITGGLITGIALNIKKNAAINEAQRTVDAAFNDLERRLASAIENSVSVDSATNGTLSLVSATSENDNAFSLTGNSVFYGEGTDTPAAITGADVKIDVLNFKLTPPQSVNIDPINHWAYNDVFGWIDFGQTGISVKIPTGAGDLTGIAWGKSTGYVFLNCLSTDNCATSNYKVSADVNGSLSGYAWSETMGWISFCGNSGGTNNCVVSTMPYGVVINQNTGEFTGQAWSEVAGYISFNCATGSATGTSVCSTSNYKVQDLRRKTTAVTADIKISYNVAPYQNTFRSGSVTFNLKQPSKVTVISISPISGTGVVNNITIHGTYFKTGALVKLVRSGYKDIYPTTNFSFTNSTTLSSGVVDLTGVQAGVWDVEVINPDGQIGYLTGGFTVTGPAIGQSYGGGKVAYFLVSGDPGYVAGVQHGLIAAAADNSTGIIWAIVAYQSTSVPAPGAAATALGAGLANSNAIVTQNGAGITYAAGLCRAYTGGSYSDWYLPSKDELNKLYLNQTVIGGFTAYGDYWSSSEYDASSAWGQYFYSGGQNLYGKSISTSYVRCVRGF